MTTTTPTSHERTRWAASRARLDPFRPQGCFAEMERTETGEILSTATVLLTNRECPWRCVYCDLWKHTTTTTVPRQAVPAQIELALHQLRESHCRQIKLYNAGSFFDARAIPPADFPAIAGLVRAFERVIVECHPSLVGDQAVRFRDLLSTVEPDPLETNRALRPAISAPAKLEVAMGLEIADDALLARLNRRMTLAQFQRAATFLLQHSIAVRAFVMVKPPFVLTEAEALRWAERSIDFSFGCGATAVSLIPARFGADQLDGLARAGTFAPPSLDLVENILEWAITQRRGRVFVDLWDIEKLGSCCSCLPDRVARLREMNLSQSVPPRISCPHIACKPVG